MIGPNIWQRLLVVCVTILLAALALQWTSDILREIWPTLVIASGVVLVVVGIVTVIRWQRSRW